MDVDRIRRPLLDLQSYGVGGHLCDYGINEQDVIDVIDGLRKANEWQTMDAAPTSDDAFLRDVKPCLVFGPEIGVKIGRAWRYPDGEARADAEGFHGNWLITHWMPLPSPPTDRRTPEQPE